MTASASEVRFAEAFVETPFGQMFTRSHTQARHPETSIVLVHGMIISGSYMMPLARILSFDYRVFVPDLPGYGRSDKPDHILRVPELADALVEWMKGLRLSKAHLVANSFGCQIAAQVAANYPERVDKLILQGPTVDAHARSLLLQALRMKLNSYRESKSVGVISVRDYRAAGPRRILKTISMTLQDRIEETLPRIQAPTLVVRGGRDIVVPESWAEEVMRLLPQGRLIVIPNAAHTLNYSEPDKFAAVIRHFLADPAQKLGVSP